MPRCLSLPYKSSNPRTVRGAKKRGWYVVKADKNRMKPSVSWVGLNIWAERACAGYWVSSWHHSEFAFENSSDATMFKLKWS